MSTQAIEYNGRYYKVKRDASTPPEQTGTLAFLVWLNRWTYKRGYRNDSATRLPNIPIKASQPHAKIK